MRRLGILLLLGVLFTAAVGQTTVVDPIQVAKERVAAEQRAYSDTKALYDAGMVTIDQLSRAEVTVALAKSDLAEARLRVAKERTDRTREMVAKGTAPTSDLKRAQELQKAAERESKIMRTRFGRIAVTQAERDYNRALQLFRSGIIDSRSLERTHLELLKIRQKFGS